MKAPRPCDQHNIWSDFTVGDFPKRCIRCGWFEKEIEVYALEWMIDGKRPPPKLRVVTANVPAVYPSVTSRPDTTDGEESRNTEESEESEGS